MRIGGRHWLILSAIIGALATTAIALTPPATEFEPSIYAAYPLWAQTLFALSLAGTIAAAFRGALDENRQHWLAAITLVFGLYTTLFLLPVLRQYALFGRGSFDTLAHIGYIKTIVDTGGWTDYDWYPAIHIIGALLEFIGIPENALVAVIQSAFFPAFVVSTFLFTKVLLNERAGMLAGTVTLPLVFGSFHATIHPFLLSFFLFPLVMFAAHQQSTRWSVIVAPLVAAFVIFHPVTTAVTLIYLSVSAMITSDVDHSLAQPSVSVAIGGGIALTYWYFGFDRVGDFIAGMFGIPAVSSQSGGGAGSLTLEHTIIRATQIYGDVALLAGMAVVAALILTGYVVWGWRRGEVPAAHLSVTVYVAIGLALAVGLFAGPMANPIRTGRFFLLFGAIAVGAVVVLILDGPRTWTQGLAGVVALLTIVAAIIGAGGIYPNGNHLTEEESQSVNWMLDYTTTDTILSLQMSHKMTLAERGFHGAPEEWRFSKYDADLQLPSHLGYSQNQRVAGLHDTPFYIYTKAHDTEFYRTSYREQWDDLTWYSRSDLRRLGDDPTANRIYSSGFGDASVWRVANG